MASGATAQSSWTAGEVLATGTIDRKDATNTSKSVIYYDGGVAAKAIAANMNGGQKAFAASDCVFRGKLKFASSGWTDEQVKMAGTLAANVYVWQAGDAVLMAIEKIDDSSVTIQSDGDNTFNGHSTTLTTVGGKIVIPTKSIAITRMISSSGLVADHMFNLDSAETI